MKKIIFLLTVCFFQVIVYSQEQVFSYDSNGKIITKSKYIETYENGSYTNITPYTLKVAEPILSNTSYNIRCLKYKGWDSEPGDFQVIDIQNNGISIFTLKKDEGWIKFPTELGRLSLNATCYPEKLNDNTFALFFIGTTIASQPPYLTIIVIKNGAAYLVFNKPFFIEDITKNNYTKFRLQANTVEWINENKPYNQPITNTLSIQDGMIFFN